MNENRLVRPLSALGSEDAAIAGGKGANLGELTRAGLPVPPGFVITAPAYLQSMQQAGLRTDLRRSVADARAGDPGASTEPAAALGRKIRDAPIPAAIVEPILAAYRDLGEPAVAVRSSGTAEDTAGTSFAGMHDTFTNVCGQAEMLTCIRECWASTYGARAIAYRLDRRIADEPAMAVVVQTMIQAERSGVIFSADPTTGDRDRVLIEAAFGLGEVVAGGQLVPDTYVLDGRGPLLREIRIGYKDHKIVRGPDGGDLRVDLPVEDATRRVLSDDEAAELARLALRVQKHYGHPQDLEWAMQSNTTYLLQSRTISAPAILPAPDPVRQVRGRLVVGFGATPWTRSGTVRVLISPEHAGRLQIGEVLVTPVTSRDWLPALRRAGALVSDGGGMTCHAAIISRELGIPCVVGTRTATHVLHDGQQVTVDGRRGVIEEAPGSPQARAGVTEPRPGQPFGTTIGPITPTGVPA